MRENYLSELRISSRGEFSFLTQAFAYRKLVENHSVEGEVLVVDRVQRSSHHSRLHLGGGCQDEQVLVYIV